MHYKNATWMLLAGAIAAVGATAFAQATGDVDRWWKPDLDATVAAPENHKILFENDEVRVLEVTVAPGALEHLHVHRYPAVMYVDSSPHMIEHLQDGSARDLGVRPPGTRWLPLAQGHAMENVGNIPLHAIRVELKKSR